MCYWSFLLFFIKVVEKYPEKKNTSRIQLAQVSFNTKTLICLESLKHLVNLYPKL